MNQIPFSERERWQLWKMEHVHRVSESLSWCLGKHEDGNPSEDSEDGGVKNFHSLTVDLYLNTYSSSWHTL